MNTKLLIAALQTHATIFEKRVTGAADFTVAYSDAGAARTMPFAWVVPTGDEVRTISSDKHEIKLTDNFSVMVLLDASADLRGQDAAHSFDAVRDALFDALLGWVPDKNTGEIEYEGAEPMRLDRARAFYKFDFSSQFTYAPDVAHHTTLIESLPNLEGLKIAVDYIDPPPSGLPGPDGHNEHEAYINLNQG